MSIKYLSDDRGNLIHPTAIISDNSHIGSGNIIGPYCVIHDNVTIGNENIFESHVSVGSPAEHKDIAFNKLRREQKGQVTIGDGNNIREFVTINKPTIALTSIGNDCYIMRGSHISHDTHVESDVIMSCNVTLGGHTVVLRGAYMGLNSCTHPSIVIGHYSMIGMGAVVTKNVPPMRKAYGIPAKVKGYNTVGISRNRLESVDEEKFIKIYEETVK